MGANVVTGPPPASILFRLPAAKNAMNLLSGDQNGVDDPAVPVRGCAVVESSERIHIMLFLVEGSLATNAIFFPFGEIAKPPEKIWSLGGRSVACTGSPGFGVCSSRTALNASAAMMEVAATTHAMRSRRLC